MGASLHVKQFRVGTQTTQGERLTSQQPQRGTREILNPLLIRRQQDNIMPPSLFPSSSGGSFLPGAQASEVPMAPSELLCCSQPVAFAAVLEKGGILGTTYKIAARARQEALGPGAGMGGSFPGSRSQLGSHKRSRSQGLNQAESSAVSSPESPGQKWTSHNPVLAGREGSCLKSLTDLV